MDNKIKNISDAEAMLCLLKISEDNFKKGKAKPIREAFKELDKRIENFKQEQSLKKSR